MNNRRIATVDSAGRVEQPTNMIRIGSVVPTGLTEETLWIDTSAEPHALRCYHPAGNAWHDVIADPADLGVGGSHPDLTAHDLLGLATQTELTLHAGTAHGLSSHAIDGAYHSGTEVLPTQGQKNALSGTQGTPGSTNPYVTTQDARLSDARTPVAHAHAIADTTSLQASLDGKAATSHGTHLALGTTAGTAAEGNHGHASSGGGPVVVKKTSAQTNATVTLATVTGFDIPVAANTDYLLDIAIRYRSSLATAGMRVALLGPAGASVVWDYDAPGTNVSGGTDNSQTFQSQAFGAAPVVQSLAVPTINVDWLASIKALISTAATAGVVQLQFAAEVAATITIQKGTIAVLTS